MWAGEIRATPPGTQTGGYTNQVQMYQAAVRSRLIRLVWPDPGARFPESKTWVNMPLQDTNLSYAQVQMLLHRLGCLGLKMLNA